MAYTDTPNMPLHMPTPGTREPAQISLLNENCVVLANHDHTTGKGLAMGRMRSGLAANRPAPSAAGNVYFSTDTGIFNVDTGTAWVQFLTSGGQATVTGWTLVDPIVRDTIQWGPEGSGTIDGTLTRTAAGVLKWISTVGAQLWIESGGGANASGIMFSRAGSNRWIQQVVDDNTKSPYILYDYGNDGSLFLERIRVTHDTDAELGNIMLQGGNPTNRSYLNLRFRDGARSWVEMKSESSAGLMRFGQPVGGPTVAGMWISSNCDYSAAGGNWNRDDTTKGAWNVSSGDTTFAINHAKAGANPITSFLQRLGINASGTVAITSDAGQRALTASSDIHVVGAVTSRVGGGENLGGMWLEWSDSTRKAFIGLDSAQQNDYRIYSAVAPAGNRFIVNLTNGIVTLYPTVVQDSFVISGMLALGQVPATNDARIVALAASAALRVVATAYLPFSDNYMGLGAPSLRWGQIYSGSASISTSHVSLKHGFAPLDPVACTQAVLDTDWLSFAYNDPVLPPREQEDDEAWAAKEAGHRKMLEETAFARQQKGYVLGSDEYRTADLFGQADRYSASTHADLAVVACALQSALKRIAELEARNATAA